MSRALLTTASALILAVAALSTRAQAAPTASNAAPVAAKGLRPNLAGHVGQPLRYKPDKGDFVIENGVEFFNRSLYGGHTAFRVDGGDKPEFLMYLPGRGGNLRLAIKTPNGLKWLKDARHIVMRYRPGELIYEISDPAFGTKALITLEVLAYASTEGLIVRTTANGMAQDAELIWVYGGVNGQRGSRDGDIGTERVPIRQYFQFKPEFSEDNRFDLTASGFTLKSAVATIRGTLPVGARQHVADGDHWNDLSALLRDTSSQTRPVVVGTAPLVDGKPLYVSLQRIDDGQAPAAELDAYAEVATKRPSGDKPSALLPAFTPEQLPAQFASARQYFDELRSRVRVSTPDPYLDAAVGSLNIVTDALWDNEAHAIMHGAIAWRTKLLGWRGPYALDDLGWHDRARQNIDTWLPNQNMSAIGPIPPADPGANLARNEAGLHSNGDLSNSHYDMNLVFIDAVFRHLLWTGDANYARKVWPAIERHLAWEKRLFRREYGPDHLPLYEAYADIWASDDLYYGGGGTAYASAYNVYANRMAARIAVLAGQNPAPYTAEADLIEKAMRTLLWQPDMGTFAESKDLLGRQIVHRSYGLWNFYHSIDEESTTAREAWSMGTALKRDFKAIPVAGPGVPNDLPYHVYAETDWMPYTWSINNVVMDENMHTALALWQGGHSDDAYTLSKGAILASMYMGISPGNVGTMNYLDVYRRESQRDFADSAGTMSRAIVEGLFGIHPDALAGTLTITPGFPDGWAHADIDTPDIGVSFRRTGLSDVWNIRRSSGMFRTVTLRVPAAYTDVAVITVDGKAARWRVLPDAVGRPLLEIAFNNATASTVIHITWKGTALDTTATALASASASALEGKTEGDFVQKTAGAFTWWSQRPKADATKTARRTSFNWRAPVAATKLSNVDMSSAFNDKVSAIFEKGKYLSPRSPGVSLELPSQGIGAWAGHVNLLPVIDDSGLRQVAANNGGKLTLPNGVTFVTPGAANARNIVFTSQWDNYPREVTIPLNGQAKHIYLLMAGSTNAQQSRIDNGEVIVSYTDGTSARLALKNPDTWWPIEQDYFIDDYQFVDMAPLPPRIDLKTGQVRLLDPVMFKGKGRNVDGGAATVLELALDPTKTLKSLTVRTLANEVVVGLMSATLERP